MSGLKDRYGRTLPCDKPDRGKYGFQQFNPEWLVLDAKEDTLLRVKKWLKRKHAGNVRDRVDEELEHIKNQKEDTPTLEKIVMER